MLSTYIKKIINSFKKQLPIKETSSNINSNDEYIIEHNGFTLTFKKNGIIHREAGPAIFGVTNPDRQKYFYLEDIEIYKIKEVKINSKELDFYFMNASFVEKPKHKIAYYLNGINYSEKEFYALKLGKELEKELHIQAVQEKVNKIKL